MEVIGHHLYPCLLRRIKLGESIRPFLKDQPRRRPKNIPGLRSGKVENFATSATDVDDKSPVRLGLHFLFERRPREDAAFGGGLIHRSVEDVEVLWNRRKRLVEGLALNTVLVGVRRLADIVQIR